MQLTPSKAMLSSSLVTLFNIHCIDASCRSEAQMYINNKANSIVALITCSVKNISCIAAKSHKQIGCDVSSVSGEQKLIESDIKYFLIYDK